MSTGFWESLRIGFLQLRQECAINPPSAPAGRLTAIWTAQPPPGEWELSYWDGVDGYGVTKRFQWHAQSAAARLGFGETGQKAVWFWLDRVRSDAPESHLRPHLIEASDGDGQMFSVEILDICGLSADYCRKCEADENRAALQNETLRPPVEQTSTVPERPAAPTLVLNAEPGGDEHSSGNVSYQKAPFFEYQYPRDFPDAEQLSIESARLDANLQFENRAAHSYDEHRAARTEWFWNVVSAAATGIGRAGDTLKWGANRRRETLLDFAIKAAQSVGIFGRDGFLFRKLLESEEWQALDQSLFGEYPRPGLPATEMSPKLEAAPALSAPEAKQEPQITGPDEPKQTNAKSAPPPERLMRKVGDVWLLSFGGKSAYVKDSRGLRYILYLLQAPDQTVYSLQLLVAAVGQPESPSLGSSGKMLDEEALGQYRERIDDIESRLTEAERNCDQAQKEALMEEKARLEQEVDAALGLGGQC